MKALLRLAAALPLAAFALTAHADEVEKKFPDGKVQPFKGKIIKDDAEGVTLEMGSGVTIPIRRAELGKVKYDCLQNHYDYGVGAMDGGDYDTAISRFNDALKDKDVSPQARQHVLLRIAQCREKQGKTAEALEAWKKLQAEYPTSAFKREAVEGLFGGYLKIEKFDEAARALAALKEGLGEEGKVLAAIYAAELYERKGIITRDPKELDRAAGDYLTVARSESPAELASRAWAGRARCLLMAGQAAEARAAASEVLKLKGFAPLAAADAHQVLAECALAGASSATAELAKDENREKVLNALDEMLRTLTQYKGSAWAEPRTYHLVAFWSGKLHAAAAPGDWQARQAWASRQLAEKYRGWKPEDVGLKK